MNFFLSKISIRRYGKYTQSLKIHAGNSHIHIILQYLYPTITK